ncbi:MAG: hypothetical protein P4K93_03135 [Terracidiphilus sp.]|nr:hypothetical protein [Terracidiphilus sp.]MDR3797118.1 hypothetical protein [Terracidiphilus sp.]
MGAGNFLKNAWDATAGTVQSGLKAASVAMETAEDVAVAAIVQGQAILTGARTVSVLAQVPTYAMAQVAALVFAKVPQLFSADTIESIISPCPLNNQQRLANSLLYDQNLLAKAAANGLQNNPSVAALQKAAIAKAQALMSDDVYKDAATVQIPGYQRLTNDQIDKLMGRGASAAFDSASPNFHAALYESTIHPGQYTLAFRGTDPTQQSDLVTDANNALGLQTGAYGNAISLAKQVSRTISRIPGATMEVTGHSLGGGLAQAASARTGATGNVFNAAGYDPGTFPQTGGKNPSQNLTDYTVAGEPLTTFQNSVVGVPAALAQQVTIPGPLSAGLLGLHGMDSVESGMKGIAKGTESDVSRLVNSP